MKKITFFMFLLSIFFFSVSAIFANDCTLVQESNKGMGTTCPYENNFVYCRWERWFNSNLIAQKIVSPGTSIGGLYYFTDRMYACNGSYPTTTTTTTEPTTTTTIPVCNETWLDNYKCVGNYYLEREYQKTDCSTRWINWTYCTYGCVNNSCLGSVPDDAISVVYSDGGTALNFPEYFQNSLGQKFYYNMTFATNNVRIKNIGSYAPLVIYVCGLNFPGYVKFMVFNGTYPFYWQDLPDCDVTKPHNNSVVIASGLSINQGVSLYNPLIIYTKPWTQGTLYVEYEAV